MNKSAKREPVTNYHGSLRRPFGTIVFLFNLFICFRLFRLEYSQFMGSIEAAYIGISRHILASAGDLRWWPAWYGGIPFQNAYPPLLHFLVAGASALFRISIARAHHVVTAFFYCLGPATAYWMAARITGKKVESLVAALLYSVVTPSAFLIPTIAGDMNGAWNSRRLQALVFYGEGPHIMALALLPLAVLIFDIAAKKKRPEWYFLSALSMAAVALSNWLGAAALAALMLAYLLHTKDWLRSAIVALAAYLLASPWIPPSTIAAVRLNAPTVGGDFTSAGAHLLWSLPFIAAAVFLMRKLPVFAIFAALMAIVTLGQYWFHFAIAPQPERYHLEMDLGIVFALVLVVHPAISVFVHKRAQLAAFWIVMLFCGWRAWKLHIYGRSLIQPIDITATVERRSAVWYARNMPGERVMVPGSVEFWLNAFGEQPEFGGGFLQGDINRENREASYLIANLNDAPDAVLWLKALGVHAVQTSGTTSREIFKAFRYPQKFDGVLDVAWKEGDDTIYRVPGDSLAHVMRKEDLVRNPPTNGLDLQQVRQYVAALNHPAKFTWRGTSAATVDAQISPGQIVSVQENYQRGWHADKANVFPDALGMIALDPSCSGQCRIELTYDGGIEMKMAKVASASILAGFLTWILIYNGRKFRSAG